MGAIGKHWYNNGEKESFLAECPEGWTRGRLPVSEETRRKHRENNGMHKLTEEQKTTRSGKLKAAQANMSEEKKLQRSKNISEARKGKGLGQTPWNKGKKGVQVAWNKGTAMSENQKQLLRDAWNNLSEEEKELRKRKISESHKGKEAHNKGSSMTWEQKEKIRNTLLNLPEEEKLLILQRQYNTKILNRTCSTSDPEDNYYNILVEKYGADDVVRQYKEGRYPFSCDFYIKSEDLFIELNLHWSHGGHLYNPNNSGDVEKLNMWKEKSKTSQFYTNAIEVWTIRDPLKFKTALDNNLNYKVFYKEEELYNG